MEQRINFSRDDLTLRAKHDVAVQQVGNFYLGLKGILLRGPSGCIANRGDTLKVSQQLKMLIIDFERPVHEVIVVEEKRSYRR